MPTLFAIHSAGDSIANFLKRTYPADMQRRFPCDFQLASGAELGADDPPAKQATLFLYRIGVNPHLRNVVRREPFVRHHAPLTLDLHYLLTVWQDHALAEHVVFGWVLQQLNEHPVLDSSFLSPDGGWQKDDSIELLMDDLSSQDLFHIWDRLRPSYRLSVGYVARVIRIDGFTEPDGLPVVGERFSYETRGGGR